MMQPARNRKAVSPEGLAGIIAFQKLSLADRGAIAKRCYTRHFSPGQHVVFSQGVDEGVFFIISGELMATLFSSSGRQVILQTLRSGEMFGELSAIDGAPRSAHIVAVSETTLCVLPVADFRYVLETYPEAMWATLRRMTAMARRLSERLFEVSALPVRQRLHAELLRLALNNTQDGMAMIRKPPTHAELANCIGAQRESVTRELRCLKRAGVIAGGRSELIVPDVNRLRDLLGLENTAQGGQPPAQG